MKKNLRPKNYILVCLFITSAFFSCKKRENLVTASEAIIGKWYWEKHEDREHTYTNFSPAKYFSFDENGVFIEYNGDRKIPGTYRLSSDGDSLFTKRSNYSEGAWLISTLNDEYLTIEKPNYKYSFSKKLGIPNSYLEVSVEEIFDAGTLSASVNSSGDASVFVFSTLENLIANQPSFKAVTNAQGIAKIKVPDRTQYFVTTSKGNAVNTTSEGYLINGIFTISPDPNHPPFDAKIGDIILADINGDAFLNEDDKRAYREIWRGRKNMTVKSRTYILKR